MTLSCSNLQIRKGNDVVPAPKTLKFIVVMKKLLLIVGVAASCVAAYGQQKYMSAGGEIILSWANAKQAGADVNTITRFAPVFNFQTQFHYDRNNNFGLFTGFSVRNLGFIYEDPLIPSTVYKARTYTIGVPLAIKVGTMDKFLLFAGYEIEFPFAFKQKKFVNEIKEDKFTSWFSKRVPPVYQSWFVGVQGPLGIQLKFKYYFTNFFNKSYSAVDNNGVVYYPYQDMTANVFYISLSSQFRKGSKIPFAPIMAHPQ